MLGHIERMNRKAVRRMGKQYREGVIAPLLDVISTAEDAESARRRLNGGLLRRMATRPVVEAAAGVIVQSALIGRTTATKK